MKVTDFPLGEIPYMAIERLTRLKVMDPDKGGVPIFDNTFIPSDMIKDLGTGKPTPLVYWYPDYIDMLYQVALNGGDYFEILKLYNFANALWFKTLFEEVDRKLLALSSKEIKKNHLEETSINNGRVRMTR